MQRLRIRFSRGEQLKYISHLDLMRLWERVLRRAEIPLAYSEGFNPRPRLSLAAPLAMGVTSEAELMDIYLKKWLSPHFLIQKAGPQLPDGIDILETRLVAMELSSLQSVVRCAEYRVEVDTEKRAEEVESLLGTLLSSRQLPWEHMRDTSVRRYDLRALIDNLWLISCTDSRCTLGMRLRNDNTGSGRPEQVTLALGFPQYPKTIHRTRLII